jgi:hypothetical protein
MEKARIEKIGLMVRDGADAPPHHEESRTQSE